MRQDVIYLKFEMSAEESNVESWKLNHIWNMSQHSLTNFIDRTKNQDRGEGFVVIQPYEEAYFQAAR